MIGGRVAGLPFHSNHKRIARGALVIAVFTLVAKLFVAGREVAIAWRYGVSGTVDSYQLALTATTWVPMMFAGVMASVLVPYLVRLDRDAGARAEFLSELNGTLLVLAGAIAALTWLFSPFAAELLASHQAGQRLQLTTSMARHMAGVAALMVLSAYLCARLQARQRYAYSMSEAVPAVTIALFLLAIPHRGELPLVLGTTIGFVVQLLLLGMMTLRSDAPLGGIDFSHRSTHWRAFRGSFALMAAGQLLITASIPIDQGFAARLGEGSVAILGYATRILTLISGLGTLVIGRALLPVLCETAAAGELLLARHQARLWALFLGVCATLGSAMLWGLVPLIVRLIFERGAFTAQASADVARLVAIGLLQLPFYFAGIALVQWYAATERFQSLLWISAAALLLKLVVNIVLTPTLGLSAMIVSTVAMYMLVALLLFIGTGTSVRLTGDLED